MALNIKSPVADRLARELAAATDESITQAVITSLEQRLERVRSRARGSSVSHRLERLADEYGSYPVTDERSDEEIIGYDDDGLPQ